MKYFLTFTFIISAIVIKSQSKSELSELQVRYNFTFIKDTLDKNNSVTEPMILLTNGKKSVYYSEYYKTNIDALNKQLEAPVNKGDIRTISFNGLPQAKVKHSVYKDQNDILISVFMRDLYTFKSSDILSWKISKKENKSILGYKCSKATVTVDNKSYIAWFTYDIPINDGPYKFRGLPGLILQVSEEHGYFNFEAISINKVKLAMDFKKGILITKDQYIKKRNEYISDPSQGKENSESYRRYVEENKKKSNIFLE